MKEKHHFSRNIGTLKKTKLLELSHSILLFSFRDIGGKKNEDFMYDILGSFLDS